ncbi:hypothetical protein ACFL1U_02265 [Patescibacteria group bacterium]
MRKPSKGESYPTIFSFFMEVMSFDKLWQTITSLKMPELFLERVPVDWERDILAPSEV